MDKVIITNLISRALRAHRYEMDPRTKPAQKDYWEGYREALTTTIANWALDREE